MATKFFYNHSCHTLELRYQKHLALDVLSFHGEEHLSQPYRYSIEFTCAAQDIAPQEMLKQVASFSIHPALDTPVPALTHPLRCRHGVITGFKRLSGSRDEARYEATLEPQFALLERGKQSRVYLDQSAPEIVKHILVERHQFETWQLDFLLVHEYPRRPQVMQYDESDLAFISRLLAEVGIWYRFSAHSTVNYDVVEFRDHQKHYQYNNLTLPHRQPSGLKTGEDGVWGLQTEHQVVEKNVNIRAYDYLNVNARLDEDVDQTDDAKTTYGEAYHYAEPYTELGDPWAYTDELQPETGIFYARLRHEHYLNNQTRMNGTTSLAGLLPSQMLEVSEPAPQAFAKGVVIVRTVLHAARDSSLVVTFEAIPYLNNICFRPPVLPKPKMAGTVPARVTCPDDKYLYGDLDVLGRYKVRFLFDRNPHKEGAESAWLRLARPYAGDTHGLHLPLIHGTEVAIAFEQGDPDRPYIAHALHDSKHLDHVTLKNEKRNVLRTPANNKLRMEDERGKEHVKLSTDFGGKSQLNLGHVVDASRRKRGEGFELRSDGWGAIRGGKGVFISADEQAKAGGDVLAMDSVTAQIEGAQKQLGDWQDIAKAHHSRVPAIDGLSAFKADAKGLSAPAMLLSAPNGIGAITPASLLLKSGDALYVQSTDEINLAAGKRLAAHSSQGMSLLAQQEGMRLVSGKGPLEIESHGDLLNLIAQQDITVQSVQGHIQLTAKNGITLGCGGGVIRINPNGDIDIHSPGTQLLKGKHVWEGPIGQEFPLPELPQSVCEECLAKAMKNAVGFVERQ